MEVINYTEARKEFKSVLDRVVGDHTQIAVARNGGDAVVLVSLEDWNAMQETMHLLATPANEARLRRSIAQLDEGHGKERHLVKA